jgi:hypothetical protein
MGGALIVLSMLGACTTTPEDYYRSADSPEAGGYGYIQSSNPDGTWSLKFRLPVYSGGLGVEALWDRRAAEICGNSNYKKTIYRAERGLVYDYQNYVHVAGDYHYEGFLDCGARSEPVSAQP